MEGGTASTDVMEAPEWVEWYSVEEGGAEELWELVSKMQQCGELIRAVPTSTTSKTKPTTTPSEASSTTPPSDATSMTTSSDAISSDAPFETTPSSAPPPNSKPDAAQKPATVRQALEALAGACSREKLQDFLKNKEGKVLGTRRLIHFIDAGGQGICHDIHPVLITSPSVYLVVFSLKDFHQKNDEGRRSYFKSELIQRPLRSIYTFGIKTPQDKGHLEFHPEAPEILVVGTHLDQIPQDSQKQFLKTVDEMIKEEISSKPYHQFVQYDTEGRSFWAVDNTKAGREQDEDVKEYISTLRLMVQDRSMEMSVKVPLPWMLLKMVMEGKGVRYCKYSELLKEAHVRGYVREHSANVDLDIMLRLFHILGLFYHKVPKGYKKEDSLVFIDPGCLYSATSDFLMAAKEEIEDSQRGSHEVHHQIPTLLAQPNMESTRRRQSVLRLADPFDMSKCQEAPDLRPLALRRRDPATSQKPRQIATISKDLGEGIESVKVVQRISNSVNAFSFDMHTVLCSLERVVMNVGQEPPEVVSQNLMKIQEGVEEKNSSLQDVNTLQSKYRILAKEMVFRLMNTVREVLQSSMPEDKKPQLDSIMKDFWFQCRMTRRSIEVDDFNHLLLLLTELRIIARLNRPKCYLIPAALPQHDQIPEEGDVEPLLFTLISQDDLTYYLPSGLFCCLISELVTELGWTVDPRGRTHVAFTHKDLTGRVHIIEHESYIEIKLELTLQVKMVCNIVREQIDERINHVYSMIYDPPESRSAVAGPPEPRSVVLGFKCNCGRDNTPHLAAYEEDEFECCTRCLLQGSTELHIHPLTQQQLVWFPPLI